MASRSTSNGAAKHHNFVLFFMECLLDVIIDDLCILLNLFLTADSFILSVSWVLHCDEVHISEGVPHTRQEGSGVTAVVYIYNLYMSSALP